MCSPGASTQAAGNLTTMKISVHANGTITVFELNDSPAAAALYEQLPLECPVEDFASNEKIFYPPNKLTTSDTPLVSKAPVGALAYYAPWGNVVMFYQPFGSAPGLYALGHAISGQEQIRTMSGTLQIAQEKP
nr:cyclophilin-like fold protein [uncultured Desulfuromonas sp.]